MEGDDRQLNIKLTSDVTIDECIAAGKERNVLFVGTINGDECWGSNDITTYPRVGYHECDMECSHDYEYCGGIIRADIYDIREFDLYDAACNFNEPEDCTQRGGYDVNSDD